MCACCTEIWHTIFILKAIPGYSAFNGYSLSKQNLTQRVYKYLHEYRFHSKMASKHNKDRPFFCTDAKNNFNGMVAWDSENVRYFELTCLFQVTLQHVAEKSSRPSELWFSWPASRAAPAKMSEMHCQWLQDTALFLSEIFVRCELIMREKTFCYVSNILMWQISTC